MTRKSTDREVDKDDRDEDRIRCKWVDRVTFSVMLKKSMHHHAVFKLNCCTQELNGWWFNFFGHLHEVESRFNTLPDFL